MGQAIGKKGIQGRITNHLSKFRRGINSPHLQASWNKYGADAFMFEALLYCPIEQCDHWEDYFIDMFQSWQKDKGYNLDRFSRGTGPRSESTIEKIKLSNAPHRARVLKLLQSPESRMKAIQSRKETTKCPIWRKNLSLKLLEVYQNPEKRKQRKEMAKEIQNRPEVKDQLRKIKLGRVWCNNGTQHKFVKPIDIPDGWVTGSLTNRATCKGRKYYINPKTGEVKRLLEAPEGWVLGRKL